MRSDAVLGSDLHLFGTALLAVVAPVIRVLPRVDSDNAHLVDEHLHLLLRRDLEPLLLRAPCVRGRLEYAEYHNREPADRDEYRLPEAPEERADPAFLVVTYSFPPVSHTDTSDENHPSGHISFYIYHTICRYICQDILNKNIADFFIFVFCRSV